MLTDLVSKLAIPCLEQAGYLGATFLMALESMVVPIPSEAVMPFVGFLVADGRWDLRMAILAASVGSLIGSAISYAMGYYGGRPFVLKVGRYMLLNPHDLEMTERFFGRRQGALAIFISRFTPVVRHLISIPAGTGKMKILPFLTATLLGAALWNTFLLVCGMYLRQRWEVVQQYSHQVDLGVGVLLAAGMALFVIIRWKRAVKVS
ncbi:MAG: DedA family protein [Syntrophobacteraceae bacterium]|nr:DedA family protein [Syntrophobacteraceae bacterium]